MSLTLMISLGGLVIAVVSIVLSRIVTRRIHVKVHRAIFFNDSVDGPECYFVNVTNVSLNREVEITHVWFDCPTKLHVLCRERPLPKRLKADETWETWIGVNELPHSLTDDDVYKLARVRLSTGKVFRSRQNEGVPSFGIVPGGDPPKAPTGTV
jgi:hypothetical protein